MYFRLAASSSVRVRMFVRLDLRRTHSNLNTGVAVPSSNSVRCSHILVGLGLVLCSARPAFAEENASDRVTARALAGEGYAALEKKDYVTAEDRFRRANELVHAPTLVLDRARALVGLGRFAEAYTAYESIIQDTLPSTAPAVWKRAVKAASEEIETVKPKVAWLTVRVVGTSEPLLEINGQVLPPRSLGERLPETPGEFHIVASAPGYVTQRIDQRLNAGDEKRLDITLLASPKPTPEVVIIPPPKAPPPEPASVQERGKGRRTLAYASLAAAGVGVAFGATTGILWLNARSDIKAACGGLDCQPHSDAEKASLDADKRRYDTFGTLSVVGFGVGLVGAATGVTLLLTQPKESAEAQALPASIHAYVGPGSFGVYGAFQ